MNQKKFVVWLLATRPKTLPAALSPVIIGLALAHTDGNLAVTAALVTAVAAILIQIATNFANDYSDFLKGADNEHRVGPKRATQAGWVTPGQMFYACVFTFSLAFLSGLYLVFHSGIAILIIGIVSIIAGISYTGGPLAFGYRGWGDLFVFVFFGPVAVMGTYYVQRQVWPCHVFMASCAPGLLATAILAVNNLRDQETDQQAGKKTLAVRWGKRAVQIEYLLCLAGALLVPIWLFLQQKTNALIFLPLLCLPLMFLLAKEILWKKKQQLNSTLAKTGALLLLYSILFAVGWIGGNP